MLGFAGFDAIIARDLQTARREAKARDLRCIILDLQLPDGHGEELLEDLPHDLPVVIASGAPSATTLAIRRHLIVIRKPFSADDVLNAVTAVAR